MHTLTLSWSCFAVANPSCHQPYYRVYKLGDLVEPQSSVFEHCCCECCPESTTHATGSSRSATVVQQAMMEHYFDWNWIRVAATLQRRARTRRSVSMSSSVASVQLQCLVTLKYQRASSFSTTENILCQSPLMGESRLYCYKLIICWNLNFTNHLAIFISNIVTCLSNS